MKNLALYIDLAFCLIVLPIMVAMSPIERWIQHFTAYMLCAGIWLYLVYFINRVFTVPFLFGDRKKKDWRSDNDTNVNYCDIYLFSNRTI